MQIKRPTFFCRRIPAVSQFTMLFSGLLVTCISLTASANEPVIVGVVAVPGQENQTTRITETNTTLYNGNGWICNAMKGRSPGKLMTVCRHNNAAPAAAISVDCNREKMRTANLVLLNQMSKVATIALVCGPNRPR